MTSGSDRRVVRIPYVRPCTLELDDGTRAGAVLVNVSILGAYVSHDDPFEARDRYPPLPVHLPRLGHSLRLRFAPSAGQPPLDLEGRVSWLNPRQQHPVHSLPPGFGMQFQNLPDRARDAIERLVAAWLEANPGAR
jgi:hypothetical protein